jgi:hypothetical protein
MLLCDSVALRATEQLTDYLRSVAAGSVLMRRRKSGRLRPPDFFVLPAFACFASHGSASRQCPKWSEASEGCRAVARRAKAGGITNLLES